jgi:alpha-methylacyl-CoA racemase
VPGPLSGVRVVELAGIGPAQLGVMILSDLGASVVRIDRPAHVPDSPPSRGSLELLARGRRSIALDLSTPEGQRLGRKLVDGADVLVDPYRPGVAERLGFAPGEALERNPGLVFARMTGWGQEGVLAGSAGHDINYIALVGALEPIGAPGEPPPVPLNLVGDFGAGATMLVIGVLAALLERERSLRGQVLDVAMVDGVATLLTSILQLDALGEWTAGRGGNWVAGAAPWYRAYATADARHVTIGPLEERFYALLLERLGLDPADWPQWERGRWPDLADRLTAIFASRTLEQWRADLEGTDVCFAPVLSFAEASEHPHLAARATYVRRDGVLQPAPAPRFGRTPAEIGAPPPWPGEHTLVLLGEVGLDATAVQELLARKIAQALPTNSTARVAARQSR